MNSAFNSFRSRMAGDDFDSNMRGSGSSGRNSSRRFDDMPSRNPKPLLGMSMPMQSRGMQSMPISRRSQPLLDTPDYGGGGGGGGGMGSSVSSMREQRLMQIVQQQQDALNNLNTFGSSASSRPTRRDSLSSRLASPRRSRAPRRSSRRESYAVNDGVMGEDDRRVFIGFDSAEGDIFLEKDDLLDVFEDFGPVSGIKIAPNGKYGFISFNHVTAANDAVDSLDKTSFMKGGPIMKVEHVDPNAKSERRKPRDARPPRSSVPISRRLERPDPSVRRGAKRPRERDDSMGGPRIKRGTGGGREVSDKPTVFIGYLDKVVNKFLHEESVTKLFEPFGTVAKMVVAHSKKYAFISFDDKKEGEAAIAGLHEKPMEEDGPIMRVEWVKSEEKVTGGSASTAAKSPRIKSKFADVAAKAPKLNITRDEEKQFLELEVPVEALYCCICDISGFEAVKTYVSHLKSGKHATARYLLQIKNRAINKMLFAAADLCEFQKETKALSKYNSRYNLDLNVDTAEKKAAKQHGHGLDCKTCAKDFRSYDTQNDHLCHVLHLKLSYEKGLKYKNVTPNNTVADKEQLLIKLEGDLGNAKENAVDCPMTLENQPVFDAEEVFGLEKLTETGGFFCNVCLMDLNIPEVEVHCKSYPHYQKIIDILKKKKADEITAAAAKESPKVNGDSKYTVLDEASEDDANKDTEMHSPQTGDLDDEQESEAEEDVKAAADFF